MPQGLQGFAIFFIEHGLHGLCFFMVFIAQGLHGFAIFFIEHGLHGLCFFMALIAQGLHGFDIFFIEHGLQGFAASATPCIPNIAKNETIKVI